MAQRKKQTQKERRSQSPAGSDKSLQREEIAALSIGEANRAYDETIAASVGDDWVQIAIVDKWLSGDPPENKWEEDSFDTFEKLGPFHLAYLEALLYYHSGETLGDAMLRVRPDDEEDRNIDHYNVSLMDIADRLFGAFSWGHFDSLEEYGSISRVADAMQTLKDENERLKEEVERLTKLNEEEIVWVVTCKGYVDSVFMEKEDAANFANTYNTSSPGESSFHAEPASNFDFARCRLEDGEFIRGRYLGPKRVASASIPQPAAAPHTSENPASNPKPEPRVAGIGISDPSVCLRPSRGRHFGAYPDPETMVRIRGLTTRLNLDNTALLRTLIDNEYANPPEVLPPRRKRSNRVHHFGCYPDAETWGKIRELLARYRIDNIELLSYLVEKNQ